MIIAECGQNFMGDMDLAQGLIREAKVNGADLVKFQLYDSEKLYGEKQKTELTFEQAKTLFDYGKEVGIEVFFSVFDVERVRWCEEIGVKRYKVACSQNRNNDLISFIWQFGKPCIISYEFDFVGLGIGEGLYCVPRYPAWLSDYKFSKIDFEFDYDGISDHTVGLDCARIAVARGAKIIEKHFAIDHKTGVDAEWSMTPDELAELVRFEKVVQKVL